VGTIDRELSTNVGSGIGPATRRTGRLAVLHDLHGGLIEHPMIERLQSNPNALAIAHLASF